LKGITDECVLKKKEIIMKKLFLALAFLGVVSFGCATQANAGIHVGIGIGGPGYYGGYYGPGPGYYNPYYGYSPYYGAYYPGYYGYYGYYGHGYYGHRYYGGGRGYGYGGRGVRR
jgi:hypothetical protein